MSIWLKVITIHYPYLKPNTIERLKLHGVVARTFTLTIWEAEAEDLWVEAQPELQSKFQASQGYIEKHYFKKDFHTGMRNSECRHWVIIMNLPGHGNQPFFQPLTSSHELPAVSLCSSATTLRTWAGKITQPPNTHFLLWKMRTEFWKLPSMSASYYHYPTFSKR